MLPSRCVSSNVGYQMIKFSIARYTVIGVPTQPPRNPPSTVRDGKLPGGEKNEDLKGGPKTPKPPAPPPKPNPKALNEFANKKMEQMGGKEQKLQEAVNAAKQQVTIENQALKCSIRDKLL